MTRVPLLLSLLALGLAAPAAARAADVDLLTQAGLRIVSPEPGVSFADQVSPAGDVNDDGYDDVLVAAPQYRSQLPSGIGGAAWVLYGGPGSRTVRIAELRRDQGFRIWGYYPGSFGDQGDHAGASLAALGDVNDDGYDDVAVGLDGSNEPYQRNRPDAGAVAVLFGGRDLGDVSVGFDWLTQDRGYYISGDGLGSHAGAAVAGAGDVNGDGIRDVVVGAPDADDGSAGDDSGTTYVVFGRAARQARVDLRTLTPQQGFAIRGAVRRGHEGTSVAGLGDVDGDGLDDVATGAPAAAGGAGTVTVVRGAKLRGPVDLGAPGGDAWRVTGATAADRLGSRKSLAAGDVDGDGRPDLVLGAHGSAAAWVVHGPLDHDLALAGAPAGHATPITGEPDRDAGYAVAVAGDLDEDGAAEVLLGAPLWDADGRSYAYLVRGAATSAPVDLGALTPATGLRLAGAPYDFTGGAVAGAGDVDGDGRQDLLLGAMSWQDPAGADPDAQLGQARVVSGLLLPRVRYARPAVLRLERPNDLAPVQASATGTPRFAVSPALPAGLALDPATGHVTGTPTAAGTTEHVVTLTDDRGSTRTRLRLTAVAPATGGVPGPDGKAGATGAAGAAGADGTTGATGVTGATGTAGAPGPAGPAGGSGAFGVLGVTERSTPTAACRLRAGRVTCRIGTLPDGAGAVRVALRRKGRTVATGSRTGAGSVRLAGRRVAPGRYGLRLTVTGATGKRRTTTLEVRLKG